MVAIVIVQTIYMNPAVLCRTPVIVNRGWLPRELLDAHMARDKKEEDVNVSFVGVLRHEEVVRASSDIN